LTLYEILVQDKARWKSIEYSSYSFSMGFSVTG
jgi:hypothetical protein